MEEQTINEILERLDKAGEIATEGFSVLIKQAYIDAAGMTVWAAVGIVVAYVCYRFVRNYGYLGGEHIWSTGHYDAPELGGVLFGLVGVAGVALTVGMTVGVIGRLLNPEFYAIRYLLRSLS